MRNTHMVLKGLAVVLALLFGAASAVAQQSSTAFTSNDVMGFETAFAWAAKSSTSSNIMVSSTTTRTQGSFAYAVSNPGNLVTITSAPVASTATALTGVGNAGAILQVDVLLPTVVGNTNNTGQMQIYVNSPSRGLSKVFVGDVLFGSFRPGIYNTLKFPIPSAIGSALGGGSFTDLTFIFLVSSPGKLTGPYLFDNLRVHSVQLVDSPFNTPPPPGYGGSVDFVVFGGGTPVAHTFNIGVVQVPEGFHLKLGTVGATTVQLQLGYDGSASFTCTYGDDSTDTSGKSYILTSCTGGMKAGDLVGADWAKLLIVNGISTQKIRAQLALNPVGDTAGTSTIPPMPTFWGDFDGCAPTIVAAGVTPPFAAVANPKPPPTLIPTPSTTCAAQTNQANQIANNYFNQFENSQFPSNWVVAPTPEFARRNGNGTAHNTKTGPPPLGGDPDFHYEGHVNDPPGGDWDAYYKLDGNFEPGQLDQLNSTGTISSSFLATGSGHAVLYGNDVNVLTVTMSVQTSISPTNLSNPGGNGEVHVYVFGNEITPDSGTGPNGSVDPTQSQGIGFDVMANPAETQGPGITIQIWIFQIEVDAFTSIGLEATGKINTQGLFFTFGPHVDVGAHAFGGVDVGFASGGVNVEIPALFHAALQADADATWNVNTDPRHCDVSIDLDASATADMSSGGGHVNLVASIGKCPFCYDDSWDVFDWNGLGDTGAVNLFDPIHDTVAAVELPSAATTCSQPLNVPSIVPPTTSNGKLEFTSYPQPWDFRDVPVSPNANVSLCGGNTGGTTKFSWGGFQIGDVVNGSQISDVVNPVVTNGCSATVVFAQQTGNSTTARTLTFNAEWDVTDQPYGTPINPEKNTSPPLQIFVTTPTPGPQITIPASSLLTYTPLSAWPGSLFLCGIVVGGTNTTSVTWSAPVGTFKASTITISPLPGTACDYATIWSYAPVASETDTITLTARDAMGNLIGTPATVMVQFKALQ